MIERQVGRLSEAVEERRCGPEIGGVEALGEAVVERRKELTRRPGPAPCMPQPSEVGGAAQLHGQNPLPAGPLQCLLEVLELVAFLKQQRIATFRLPERLEVVEGFPLTSVGKVSKKELREDIARKLKAV